MNKYEWRDTGHGPQLWMNTEGGGGHWVLWYGIGAIGISPETKENIEYHLNNPNCIRLTKRELVVAREALAAEATATEWAEEDRETIEAIISKMEALGAKGSL